MRRSRWPVLLAVLFAGTGCEGQESPDSIPSPDPPVIQAERVRVERRHAPAQIEITGVVRAKTRATIASKIGGVVRSVSVREGDAVRRGDVVARLEAEELAAHVARAKAELQNARIQLTRMQRLYEEDSVAKQELDNAERAFRVAKARHRAALARLRDTVIRSPLDGHVTDRSIEPGEFAGPGRPLLEVENPNTLQFLVHVAERYAASLRRGMTLPLVIDALDRSDADPPLSGRIAEIVPASDPATHTVLVKLDLPETRGLHSGMFGRILLPEEPRATLVVPVTSLLKRHDLTGVYVVGPDEIVHLRWIKTGRRTNGMIEVLSGLTDSEEILEDATQGVDGARLARSTSSKTRDASAVQAEK